MKITKQQLKQIIKEELEVMLNEVELAPAMHKALKAKGQLPAGATIRQATQQDSGSGRSDFDTKTGKPLTKRGELKCAGNRDCFQRHIRPLLQQKFSTATGQPTAPLAAIAQKAGHGSLKVDDDTLRSPPARPSGTPPKAQQAPSAQKDPPITSRSKKLAQLSALDKEMDELPPEEQLARIKALKK